MMRPAPDPIVRRIFANLARLIGGKAGAGLISLVYMVIAARELGPADYGVLMLVHTFAMTVGGIVEFPGWHAIVRYGAEAIEQRDHDRLGRLLRFAGAIELGGGAAAVATAAILGPLLGARLGWSPVAVGFAVPYSLAVLASIRSTPAGYLQLAGRFDLLGWHTLASPLVRLAGAGIAAALDAGLRGFLIAWLLAALAEWVSLWVIGLWAARREFGQLPMRGSLSGVTRENDGLWRFMIGANADVTFGELAGRIAPLVIGSVMGPVAVGYYSLAQRVTTVLAVPAQVLGQAAYAELARLVAAGGHGAPLRAALGKSVAIALVAALPVALVLVLFGRQIAVAIGGAAYAGAAGLLLWLTAARVVMLIAPPASAALVALGRPALSVAANLGAALLSLPVLPLLLWRIGIVGAGGHALLQAVATSALLIVFVARASGGRGTASGAA
jgi:O-antigen/teichoic acid export membrane protein